MTNAQRADHWRWEGRIAFSMALARGLTRDAAYEATLRRKPTFDPAEHYFIVGAQQAFADARLYRAAGASAS